MPNPRFRPVIIFPASLLLALFLGACSGGGHGGGEGGGNLLFPVFQISVTHTGNFTQGQQNATYTITVSNIGGTGPSTGNVQVTDTIPSGETFVSMSGTGWTFPGGPVATRTDSLAVGQSWPPITVTVSVAANASTPQVNMVSVAGGGANGTATAQDSTSVATAGTPALQVVVAGQGKFSSGEQNAKYTIAVTNTGGLATSGTVTVADPPTGFTITAMSGTNWTCTLATTTCTYSISVGAGQGFPPITVTGNVTASNGSAVSIPLTVSGGGASSVNSSPTVSVAAVALSITKLHIGNFVFGEVGATYSVTVSNAAGAGTTSGTVTVTEAPPAGLTVTAMAGTNWACVVATLTCTRSDALTGGSSYETITVTVNVSATATSPQVNQVSVSGGNQAGTVSPATDSTIIGSSTCPSGGPHASLLSGDYSFEFQGFISTGFFTAVGRYHADGSSTLNNGLVETNGFATGNNSAGTPIPFTGCFTVGSDDRGTMTFINSSAGVIASLAISVMANGEGNIITFNTAGASGSGRFKKQTGPFTNSSVSGDYAYGFYGLYTNISPTLVPNAGAIGHFHANGSGGVPEGLTDITTYSGVITAATGAAYSSASYSVTDTTNGRVALTFTIGVTLSGAPQTQTYHFACYIANSSPGVTPAPDLFCMGTDTATISQPLLIGQVLEQNTPSGGWTNSDTATAVFSTTGIDSAQNARVEVGVLSFNNATSTVTINEDQNKGGTLQPISLSATYSVTSSIAGRVAVTSAGADLTNVYLVDLGKGFLVETGNNAAVGFFEPQQAVPSGGFTTANFNNTFAVGTITPGDSSVTDISASLTSNGSGGGLSGTEDATSTSSSTSSSFAATYNIANSMDASLGRVTITVTGPSPDTWILYIIDGNTAVAIPYAIADMEPGVIYFNH
jgi:uncharacterized repeat protein (TIGR01451 family)